MSFLHPGLLALAGLAALPVILHFIMRPKPKRLVFPALRLIESRRKSNVRQLRLRHIWLLLLRIAVIVLLVLVVARPVVPMADYGLSGSELTRLIAVIVLAVVGYFIALRFWVPRSNRSDFLYRRTLLRGGTSVLLVLLLLAVVGWPYTRRVFAEISRPEDYRPSENRPIAAVMVFDTSRSMDYQYEGATRLDRAKEIAIEHLEDLPPGSRVAIGTTDSADPIVFQADLTVAKERIAALETSDMTRALEGRVRDAFELQTNDRSGGLDDQAALPEAERSDRYGRGVYVLTDRTRSAWTGTDVKTLQTRLEEETWLQMLLVDVSVSSPVNVGFVEANPSSEIAAKETPVVLHGKLSAVGGLGGDATVELYVDRGAGLVKEGQTNVSLTEGAGNPFQFTIAAAERLLQGEVRLLKGDPYSHDDRRSFSVGVEPAPRVLVVSDAQGDAAIWSEALRTLGFEVVGRLSNAWTEEELSSFAAIYLLNVAKPSPADWSRLDAYVRKGGGVGIILGKRVDPLAYGVEEASSVLPAQLVTQLAFEPAEFFLPTDEGHPVFAPFEGFGGYGWLTRRDVRRHYVVEPLEGAVTIAKYSFDDENRPALVLRSLASGRVAMLTTGVDTSVGWSDLPKADWPFLAFANELTRFVSGFASGQHNYLVGKSAVVRLPGTAPPERVLLRTPQLEQRAVKVPAGAGRVTIDALDSVGAYTVRGAGEGTEFESGFSVNLPPEESDFTRMADSDFDQLFGEDRYLLAKNADELDIQVRDMSIGTEFMPYVIVILIAVFCGEQFVANRFYRDEQDMNRADPST